LLRKISSFSVIFLFFEDLASFASRHLFVVFPIVFM